MIEPKNTPWRYEKTDTGVRYIRDAKNGWIADVHTQMDGIDNEARSKESDDNGVLLAASPKMLLAIQECNKESWWSEREQPSYEDLKRRLGRILHSTRMALLVIKPIT